MPGLQSRINNNAAAIADLPEFDFPAEPRFEFTKKYDKYLTDGANGVVKGRKIVDGAYEPLTQEQSNLVKRRAYWFAARYFLGMSEIDSFFFSMMTA
jgi:hypothetical protein